MPIAGNRKTTPTRVKCFMELPMDDETETTEVQSFSFKRRLLRLGICLGLLILFQVGALFWDTKNVLHSSATHESTHNKTREIGTISSSHNATNSSEPSPTKPTIVIQLGGELGNHLNKLAGGFVLKWHFRKAYGVDFRVVTAHQDKDKWVRAVEDLVHCFPKFRSWNFSRGVADWPEYKRRMRQQEKWLSNDKIYGSLTRHDRLMNSNQTLQLFLEKYHDPNKPFHPMSPKDEISLPFLISRSFHPWATQYNSLLKDLFEFDMTGDCCGITPEDDETVYHFRNFETEVGPSPKSKALLVDFSPNQTAYILLGHLKEGDKVALITRFNNQKTKKQVKALRSRGLQVRVIEGQTGVQDFCFMLKAKKELISNAVSTFATWGGVLGEARSVRRYAPVRGPADGAEYLTPDNLPPSVSSSNESKSVQKFNVIVDS